MAHLPQQLQPQRVQGQAGPWFTLAPQPQAPYPPVLPVLSFGPILILVLAKSGCLLLVQCHMADLCDLLECLGLGMGVEHSFTDVHMVWCSTVLLEYVAWLFRFKSGRCCKMEFWQISRHGEGKSGPWHLHALGTDVGEEPWQVVMLGGKTPVWWAAKASSVSMQKSQQYHNHHCSSNPKGMAIPQQPPWYQH